MERSRIWGLTVQPNTDPRSQPLHCFKTRFGIKEQNANGCRRWCRQNTDCRSVSGFLLQLWFTVWFVERAWFRGTLTSSFRDAQIWARTVVINPPGYKVTAGEARERRAEPHTGTLKLKWDIYLPMSLMVGWWDVRVSEGAPSILTFTPNRPAQITW